MDNHTHRDSFVHRPSSDPLRSITLADAVRRAAQRRPHSTALVDGVSEPAQRRRWTYAEIAAQMDAVARELLRELEPGDRVMVCSPNRPESHILQLALSAAGIVLVTVNPGSRAPEVEHIAATTGARAIVSVETYRGNDLRRVAEDLRSRGVVDLVWSLEDVWDRWSTSRLTTPLPRVDPAEVGLVIFTSGTTGKPKGAMLRHGGMVDTGVETLLHAGLSDLDRFVWVNAMPIYNMGGAGSPTHATAWFGGTHVLMREFDADVLLDLIEQERGTLTLAVPTMLTTMLERLAVRPRDTTSLAAIITGASAVPQSLAEAVRARVGAPVLISYGLTEAHGSVSGTSLTDSPRVAAETIGTPNRGIELGVFALDSDSPVARGEAGEIRIRGHQVMTGYLGNDFATTNAIDAAGWLRTGDIATMDEHDQLRIEGRAKDVIIRGGSNIYPREVEDRLYEHAAVGDVAVVGLPHPAWGEEVAAVIRLRTGHVSGRELAEELALHCDRAVARYKVPRHWYFVDAMPLTPTGKIIKADLHRAIRENGLGAVYSTASIEGLTSTG